MRKILLPLLAVLVLGSVPSFAQVYEGRDSAPATKEMKAKKHRWGLPHHKSGTVTAIDAAAGTLTINTRRGKTKTFYLSPGSKIETAEGKNGTLSDIKVGDEVSIRYKGIGKDKHHFRIMRLMKK
jgi:hypothetical protein